MELTEEAICDKLLPSLDALGSQAKILRMPGIEVGSIIEYQWTETKKEFRKFDLQRDIPFESVSYHWNGSPATLTTLTFNHAPIKWEKESKNRFGFQIRNVPGIEYEPQVPPQDSMRAYFLVFFGNTSEPPEKYWRELGKRQFVSSKGNLSPNGKIKDKASQIAGSSSDPEEIVSKIFEFVRSNIKDVEDPAVLITRKEKEQYDDAMSSEFASAMRGGLGSGSSEAASRTLKWGVGSCYSMNILFGSMAAAAGLDARSVTIANRSNFFFSPSLTSASLLDAIGIAVKVGEKWKFYDHCFRYLPQGMLPWWVEGSPAFIPDDKEPFFISTPVSPPEKSQAKRTARFNLNEDGSLEGDVTIAYFGHMDNYMKMEAMDILFPKNEKRQKDNAKDRPLTEKVSVVQLEGEKNLRKIVQGQFSTAELSDIQVQNIFSIDQPFTYKYHIKVPGYAQKKGRQLSIQPPFFQKGILPLFTAEQRKSDIYFNYPWSELDEVEIVLPQGYVFESTAGKQPVALGKMGRHEVRLAISKDNRSIHCTRRFLMGGEGKIMFSAKDYPFLKRFFDLAYEADAIAVTLNPAAAQ